MLIYLKSYALGKETWTDVIFFEELKQLLLVLFPDKLKRHTSLVALHLVREVHLVDFQKNGADIFEDHCHEFVEPAVKDTWALFISSNLGTLSYLAIQWH